MTEPLPRNVVLILGFPNNTVEKYIDKLEGNRAWPANDVVRAGSGVQGSRLDAGEARGVLGAQGSIYLRVLALADAAKPVRAAPLLACLFDTRRARAPLMLAYLKLAMRNIVHGTFMGSAWRMPWVNFRDQTRANNPACLLRPNFFARALHARSCLLACLPLAASVIGSIRK